MWQQALSDLITDPKELLELLKLSPDLLADAKKAAALFPLKVPREFVKRMEKNNVHDPLLMQILPLDRELIETPGYSQDPLQELKVNPVPGLLHKYHGRVLVTLTSACAVHCRFCFRRNFPYEDNNPGRIGWEKIINYICKDKSISEVILSGGDPLTVSDKYLKLFTDQLTTISHLKRLRIHTRLPIVLPERITNEWINWVSQVKLDVVVVVHANHFKEINEEVTNALFRIRSSHIPIINQSVLLKGVNDNIDTLVKLSEILFSVGVLPYYLHVLDKTQNTAHFDVDMEVARNLYKKMRKLLPGYLVPRLVKEKAGEEFKVLV